jgi:hypothetical protein
MQATTAKAKAKTAQEPSTIHKFFQWTPSLASATSMTRQVGQ